MFWITRVLYVAMVFESVGMDQVLELIYGHWMMYPARLLGLKDSAWRMILSCVYLVIWV